MRVLFLTLLISASVSAQEPVLKMVQAPAGETLDKTILEVAGQFLGKPYVGATLEKTPEALVVNLEEFDCFTLVENVLAISLTRHSPEPGVDTYREYLQLLRYRNGVIDGYGSRMHYFIDWARQAEDNGLLINVTEEVGEVQEKSIGFMSANRKLYPALATDDRALKAIAEAESALNEDPFYFVPKTRYQAVQDQIREGDIIAFTSVVKGLDVNHEGFAVRKDGKLHLLHASLEEKKVIVSKETLHQYLDRIKKHSGIMIFRPVR